MKALLAMIAAMSFAPAAASTAGSPLDPVAPAMPLPYASAFDSYRKYSDVEIDAGEWRRRNDEVRAVGGHAGAIGHRSQPGGPPAGGPAAAHHGHGSAAPSGAAPGRKP